MGIAHNRGDLLALRRPRAWGRALGLALLTYLGVSIVSEIVVALGLHPGSQQGLLPSGWEHGHTTPFVANTLYVVTVVPFVEETLMRGIGYGLLRPLGSAPAVVLTAGAWALLHGFPDGIPILFAFGIGLALIRERTGSTIPGMILHGIFNGIAVAVALHPF
ncbi:MAG: CPBP family intramembrane glutamic endopeptidase [Gaiellaceae bacterium]